VAVTATTHNRSAQTIRTITGWQHTKNKLIRHEQGAAEGHGVECVYCAHSLTVDTVQCTNSNHHGPQHPAEYIDTHIISETLTFTAWPKATRHSH